MVLSDLAGLNRHLQKTEQAAWLLEKALDTIEPYAAQYPGTILGLIDKYSVTVGRDKPGVALILYLERAISLQTSMDDDPREVAFRVERFAECAVSVERLREAIVAVREAVALREGCHDDMHRIYEARRFLVICLMQADQQATAQREILEVLALGKRSQKASSEQLIQDLAVAVHLAQEAGINERELDALLRFFEEMPEIPAVLRPKLQFRIATLLQLQRRHWKAIECSDRCLIHSWSQMGDAQPMLR
jgi:hypothetical protein